MSPSVYVAIQSLDATNYCGKVSEAPTPVTLGFNASALSTATAYHWDTKGYASLPWSLSYPQEFIQATWGVRYVKSAPEWNIC